MSVLFLSLSTDIFYDLCERGNENVSSGLLIASVEKASLTYFYVATSS